jgi:hypothetical protein
MNSRRTKVDGSQRNSTVRAEKVSRRDLLTGVGASAAAGSILGAASTPLSATGHEAAADDRVDNALEFVGKLIQEGGRFTGFGYATAARGLDPNSLFDGGGDPAEGAALLTIYSVSTLESIARVNGVFAARARGTFRLYWRDAAGADFSDPASFAVGTLIAEAWAEFHNTLTVTDPDQGIAHIVAALTQKKAASFSAGNNHYRIGGRGVRARLTAVGKGLRTDPSLPAAIFDLGGYVTTE